MTSLRLRNLLFIFFNILTVAIFYSSLKELIVASVQYDELYSHIILIPIVSIYFLLSDRKTIFSKTDYAIIPGILIIIVSIVPFLSGLKHEIDINQNDYLSLMTLSTIIFWAGGFTLFHGTKSLRNAAFPVLFLIFMIPMPEFIVNKIVYVLQGASTYVAYGVFKLAGVPLLREGFVFHLPGISVEVAEQCSGIRSSLALFITSIIAGHMFLQTTWRKLILSLSIFPITIMKNGARIVTLSLLGSYVDVRILTDSLIHRRGGIPFFIFALVLFIPLLWVLRKSEKGYLVYSDKNY